MKNAAKRFKRSKLRQATARVRPVEQGFALLEVVVAMAIAGLALAAFYQTIGGSLRAASRVQIQRTAILAARAHLDALGSDGTLAAGIETGTYDSAIRWRLSITDLSHKPKDATALRPFWIALQVFDRTGASLLQLETAKTAREVEP